MAPGHKATWSFDRQSQTASSPCGSVLDLTAAPSARSANGPSEDSPASSLLAKATLSVTEYHAEHRRRHRQLYMHSPSEEPAGATPLPSPPRARDHLFDDFEKGEVDYGSDSMESRRWEVDSKPLLPPSPTPRALRTPTAEVYETPFEHWVGCSRRSPSLYALMASF
ncbi:WD repeat-containing protein 44 [Phytophthora oleae]|uniref:WD repeat-containing protein 44 n=1 Tax=Phytophthora oleae TaxID=2107226 RepID=A0ABD3FVF4_9STRA